jgi:drug/metabolite transporter (DMT)-like permease
MSTYVYLNPIVALLLGSTFLKEPFGLHMAVGVALMLSGVALVQIARPAERPVDETCPGEE